MPGMRGSVKRRAGRKPASHGTLGLVRDNGTFLPFRAEATDVEYDGRDKDDGVAVSHEFTYSGAMLSCNLDIVGVSTKDGTLVAECYVNLLYVCGIPLVSGTTPIPALKRAFAKGDTLDIVITGRGTGKGVLGKAVLTFVLHVTKDL